MSLSNSTVANGSALQVFPPIGGDGGLPTNNYALVFVGTFTANGTSAVTVADAGVSATSLILMSLNTVGGTPAGQPYVATLTAGTGYTVKAAAGDTSVYNVWRIS